MTQSVEPRKPTFRFAIIVMSLVVVILIGGLLVLHVDPHLLMIGCIIVASLAAIKLGYSWEYVRESMVFGVSKAMQALFFFFLIGMAIAAWIMSGTVPALISYGLNILTPTFFLPAGFIICSISSLATGSSWSMVGTVGVALLGIGAGLGIPLPMTAGMVVAGGYFGDKMSPLSDTTNLAPAIAGANIYDHIQAMLYTTIPTYVIALIAYTVMGLKYGDAALDVEKIASIQSAIGGLFNLNVIVLLPLVVVLITSALKIPAIPGFMAGIITSFPISIYLQGGSFTELLSVLNYGYYAESGVELVDTLLNRGGIQSMMWTFSLGVIALSLGGVLNKTGVLQAIVVKILKLVKDVRYLPMATILTSIAVNLTMADQYVSIVVTGELFKEAYPEAGLQPRMLSRCLEEGGTLTSAIIPWTTCGAVMMGSLGISAAQFAPYAIVNWLNPILGMIFPILGYSLLKVKNETVESTATLKKNIG